VIRSSVYLSKDLISNLEFDIYICHINLIENRVGEIRIVDSKSAQSNYDIEVSYYYEVLFK